MLIQLPFAHIVIKSLNPPVFIFQNLIKISGPEQFHSLGCILEGQFFKVLQALHLSIACHNIRLFNNGGKSNIVFSAIAYNCKLPVLHMSRHETCAVICIVNIYRISVKSLLIADYTVRRGVHKSPDRSLPLILKRKASSVFFSLSYSHNNPRLRENNIRLWNMKISFGKTFDLIFQISHLLTILVSAQKAKNRYYELYHYSYMSCNGRIKEFVSDCIQVYSPVLLLFTLEIFRHLHIIQLFIS